MYLTEVYKIDDNGIIKIMGHIPDGTTVLEILTILNAEDGYDLVRVSDNEIIGCNLWLKDGDSQNNYKEEEHKEPTL